MKITIVGFLGEDRLALEAECYAELCQLDQLRSYLEAHPVIEWHEYNTLQGEAGVSIALKAVAEGQNEI